MSAMNLILTFSLVILFCATSIPSAFASESHKQMTGVTSKLVVHATAEEVFDAIKKYRSSDATRRKILEQKKGRCLIREIFPRLPVLGDVQCTYEETEVPYSRIDFQLIDSDKFKVFEGNWQLSPVDEGKSTLVRLTSFVDTSSNLPAKDFLTHIQTHEDIHKRLMYVKKLAESEEVQKEKGS